MSDLKTDRGWFEEYKNDLLAQLTKALEAGKSIHIEPVIDTHIDGKERISKYIVTVEL